MARAATARVLAAEIPVVASSFLLPDGSIRRLLENPVGKLILAAILLAAMKLAVRGVTRGREAGKACCVAQ